WEALLFANHFRLSNLVVIVDANGYQAMGATNDVLRLGCIAEKLLAFGLETFEVDGHDEAALDDALGELVRLPGHRPRALVAHAARGKGVWFMEGSNQWHYPRLTPEAYAAAMAELADGRASVAA